MDFNEYTNQFSLSKTLRFRLIPVGKTEEFFEENGILDTDKERDAKYKEVKKLIDGYHKDYIDRKLSGFRFDEKTLSEYAEYYAHASENRNELEALQKSMCEQISDCLKGIKRNGGKKGCEEYQQIFGKEMITELLPKQIQTDEEKEAVELFRKFTTYFNGFNQNRENMYTGDGKSTEIAYRICAQNLPKYMDNLRTWGKITENLPQSEIEAVDSDMVGLIGLTHNEIFKGSESFNLFLSQSGINKFNQYIGGYTCEDGTEIQGVNQRINLFCQKEKKKIPLLKPLFKQILSDRNSLSFIPDSFENDNQVIKSIQDYYDKIKDEAGGLFVLLSSVSEYPSEHIFVKNDLSVNTLSQIVYGNWSVFQTGIELDYKEKNPRKPKQDEEKYIENRSKELKKRADYSLKALADFALKYPYEMKDNDGKDFTTADIHITSRIQEQADKLKTAIDVSLKPMEELWSADEYARKKLAKDDHAITVIKTFLDSVKAFQHFCELFAGADSEPEKDPVFYGKFTPAFEKLKEINHLYDKVRNYITKKPYSDKKIKLNFNKPNFLNGWVDSCTENSDNGTQYGGYLFRKKNPINEYDYYVGISENAKLFRAFSDIGDDDASEYERLDYYQSKGDSIYGSSYAGAKSYDEDKSDFLKAMLDFAEIQNDDALIRNVKDYCSSKVPTPSGCFKLYSDNYPRLVEALKSYPAFSECNDRIIGNLKNTMTAMKRLQGADNIVNKEYTLFTEIMSDIDAILANKVYSYFPVSETELQNALNDQKKPLYLFKIHNKDLGYAEMKAAGNRKQRGNENLHTLYFKQLMSGSQNVFDIGCGEVFYRKASLKLEETTIHPKNVPIKNKNELNPKKESTFEYDLIKDKRYTQNQFLFHLSISLNYEAEDSYSLKTIKKLTKKLNEKVIADLAGSENQYIIGIDRGERNLLYVSVIDTTGRIVEQESLNVIENDRNDISYRTDYQKLLADRDYKRQQDRQDWKTIEGIKELKEGYLSQAVHKICQLVIKYNAVIVMENLNSGFKNTRSAVEHSVYQKFEKMLTDKLAFLADKSIPADEPGGILHAYQLALPKTSYSDMQGQNGIIFYVDPWLTSKIDPMTGFSNLLYAKYESVDKAKELFRSFERIAYHAETDRFVFVKTVDAYETQKTWKIETYGDRIEAYRKKGQPNAWDSRSVILTEEFKNLFDKYGIEYRNADLKTSIDSQTEKSFFEQLIRLFNLTMQMRNSVPHSTKPEDDYMISPVCTPDGRFYDSREGIETLPKDADANGAYNIARKGLILMERAKKADDFSKSLGGVKRSEWLDYAIAHPLK